MFKKIRPLIFKFSPEVAHSLAIKTLKSNLIPSSKAIDSEILKTKLFGKNIKNPIGVAAGFDKNAEVYNPLFNLGFGFVEVGTITPNPQYGNPKPRVFRLEEDKALINRLGFNNSGSDEISARIKKNSAHGLLGINIGPNKDTKNRVEDYLKCFRKFYNLGDYITINISSPNTENLRDFHNKNELEELLDSIHKEKIKLKSNIPIAVKISPDIENNKIESVAEILNKYFVDIAIISNTSDMNRDSLNNINKLEKGGLSGRPIEKISNDLIRIFYKLLGKNIKIIGVGGVDTGKGVLEKLLNGASLIQLYTGMVYQGPNISNKINEELIVILKKEGFENISEAIGVKNWSWLPTFQHIYSLQIMSKKCELTGKIPLKGHKVSHANNKTKRRFLPNLKKVKFKSDILNKSLRISVSNAGVRSVDKKGSFDHFLKSAKTKNLSLRLKKLKKTLLSKTA